MKTLELYYNHSKSALSFSRSDWQESFLEELHRSADDSFNGKIPRSTRKFEFLCPLTIMPIIICFLQIPGGNRYLIIFSIDQYLVAWKPSIKSSE